MTTSRSVLTVAQKRDILAEYDRRLADKQPSTQEQLALWAKNRFKLSLPPNQATISRLLSQSSNLRSVPNANLGIQKRRISKAPELERQLHQWVCDQNAKHISVSGPLVRAYGQRLQDSANALLPENQKLCLKFSNGWFARFKARFGLSLRRIHGEAGSADMQAIENALPALRSLMAQYDPKDVWNADEFGLFYRQAPGWTLSHQPVVGLKKEKSRITFLACCNANGEEKFPLMVIGNSQKPRVFRGKSGRELGFDYWSNKRAWMTKELFFDWLRRLDNYVAHTRGRKILLLVDNCTAHGVSGGLPELEHVTVHFLPPNATSHIQPLDAGIIATLKAKYRRRVMFRIFDNIDVGAKSVYNVDVLTAMRWVKNEWEGLEKETIANCWRHCFQDSSTLTPQIESYNVESAIADAHEQSVRYSRIGIQSLLNPPEEDDVIETLEVSAQAAAIAAVPQAGDVNVDQEEEDADAASTWNVDEQLKGLAVASAVFDRLGKLDGGIRRVFRECQRSLRLEKASLLHQSTILDHFSTQ